MLDLVPGLPRPRTLVHPGRYGSLRIEHMQAPAARHFRLALRAGRSLHQAIVDALTAVGVKAASMTLLDGELSTLSFCVAPPDAGGRVVAKYSSPVALAGARLVFGNATLGKSSTGDPVVHCHAVFRMADGTLRGGHLLTERTFIACGAVTVLATSLDGFDLRIGFDEETRMPLMRPQLETPHG